VVCFTSVYVPSVMGLNAGVYLGDRTASSARSSSGDSEVISLEIQFHDAAEYGVAGDEDELFSIVASQHSMEALVNYVEI